MRKEMKVTTNSGRLRKRTGPSTSYRIITHLNPGYTGIVVESKTVGGATWYKWEDGGWSCGTYLRLVRDLEVKPDPPKEEPKVPEPTPPEPVDETIPPKQVDFGTINPDTGGVTTHGSTKPTSGYDWTSKVAFDMKYPYNDQCTEAELLKKIRQVKYQMDIEYITKSEIYNEDIPTGYFSSLQKKLFNSFNRHKTAFPDKELTKTFAYVFFTRPDLNIITQAGGTNNFTLVPQTALDAKYSYLWNNNQWCLKSLVSNGNPKHKFMVLLSNEAKSFEVGDVVLKTVEHGETYNGNKIVYGLSDQESNAANEMSIRYTDTVNLDIFKLHLAWTDYINKVSRGIYAPKQKYITDRIVDYASSCYYFLCGPDGSTILYWQKLTGVFPVNTGENAFSWDSGTLLAKPEINIKYMYSFKSTMDPMIIAEFNSLTEQSGKYKKLLDGHGGYETKHSDAGTDFGFQTGSTLTHAPWIAETEDDFGHRMFQLVWKEI